MISINLHNESDIEVDDDSIRDLVALVLSANSHQSATVNIIIMDDNALRLMKKEYFNQDLYTDVIAFNIEEDPFEGEIYISHERVKENAEKYKQSFHRELKRVIIHGALHLCGYDDKTSEDKSVMTSMEENYLVKFNGKILA